MKHKDYWKTDWLEIILAVVFVIAIAVSGMHSLKAVAAYRAEQAAQAAAAAETAVVETEATETEEETEEETENTGVTMFATTDVNVRSGPGQSHDRIGGLSKGQEVLVIGTSGDWSIVIYNDAEGYVYSEYLSE